MLFKKVSLDEPCNFVGVYVVRWQPEWGEPTAAFSNVDQAEIDAAASEQMKQDAEIGKALRELPTNYYIEPVGDDEWEVTKFVDGNHCHFTEVGLREVLVAAGLIKVAK